MTDSISYPLVSVVIPSFNGSDWIVQTLESILATRYPRIEILVADDASTDDTLELVHQFAETTNEVTVRTLPREEDRTPGGGAAGRNRAMREAAGEYVTFLDQDDVYFPNRFETAISALESDIRLDAVFEPFCYVVEDDQVFDSEITISPSQAASGETDLVFPISNDPFLDSLRGTCPLHIGTVTVRRSILLETGLTFNEKIAQPDRAFLLSLLSRGRARQVGRIPVEGYRIHAQSYCSRAADDPRVTFGLLRSLAQALSFMRRQRASRTYQSALKRHLLAKLAYYYPQAVQRGQASVLLKSAFASSRVSPALAGSPVFWKIIARLVLALAQGSRSPDLSLTGANH